MNAARLISFVFGAMVFSLLLYLLFPSFKPN